jgi:hypothetical protein
MKTVALAMLIGVCACSPRQVEVRTAPPAPAQIALQVTNNLTQAVNVYVVYNGTDQFVQQVRPNTSLRLPVPGIPSGSTVSLKAVTVDGTRTILLRDVVLTGTFPFPIS